MEYLFKDTGNDKGLATIEANCPKEIWFIIACLAFRIVKAELKITACTELPDKVLTQLPFVKIKDGMLKLHPEKVKTERKVIIDVSSFPDAALALSIIFSGMGMEADITGLESYSKGIEIEQITCLQRMLYRLNINTDYCGGSKLKIFNNKRIQACSVLKPTTDDFPAWMLIPVSIKTGSLRIVLDKKVLDAKYGLINASGIAVEVCNE